MDANTIPWIIGLLLCTIFLVLTVGYLAMHRAEADTVANQWNVGRRLLTALIIMALFDFLLLIVLAGPVFHLYF